MAYRVRNSGTTTQRGYGYQHRRLRARWEPIVELGLIKCWRCDRTIPPGTPWQLGHTDDRTGYVGPEHQHCGAADGGRKTMVKINTRIID